MNILETTLIRSPNEKEEECAKFIIDDVSVPFVFHNVTDKDKSYVFSAWVKAETESTLTISDEEIPVTTEWQRQRVGYVANGSSLKIFFDNVGTYYLYRSQLEIGNAMTDWSPAPEDIEAELEVKVNTEDLISEINASANVIRLKSNRLVVESDNLQISEDGTLKTQRGEIGGFVLHDNTLSAEADRHAEINIKYHTHADAEPREGFIQIGNDAENEGGTGEAGIFVGDYDLDGNGIFTRIGNVLGGGILIETEERNDALHISDKGIARVDGKAVCINENPVADCVIDEGTISNTNGTWTYRKWANGTLECWGNLKSTITKGDSLFGGYVGYGQVYLPFAFVSTPIVNYSVYGNTGYEFSGKANTGTSAFLWYALSNSPYATGGAITIYADVKGRWK